MTHTISSIVDGFSAAYSKFHPGQTPHSWQTRLLEEMLEMGRWPDVISAPTGSGKTCVIDVHVYLNALAGEAQGNQQYPWELQELLNGFPRRLAVLAPRRALVDEQTNTSEAIQTGLENHYDDPLLEQLRDGLLRRANAALVDQSTNPPPALLVDSVRGGKPRKYFLDNDAWQTHPTYCAVIHMTPDMFGSAILFRHYGASRKRRPQDAGLLGIDTVAVVDEGHLQQQLLFTSRRIGELESVSKATGRPILQVVSTTATPGTQESEQFVVSVDERDVPDGEANELSRRLKATKILELQDMVHEASTTKGSEAIAKQLIELKRDARGPVGFISNTVAGALEVTTALRSMAAKNGLEDDCVFSVVGRMRPIDRFLDQRKYPGVLSPEGNEKVHFIVGTQALEVGIDLSLDALVTELASASALAQRAGRVNRFGEIEDAKLVVLVPKKRKPGPYTEDELATGLEWAQNLAGNISPWSVHLHPTPPPALSRGLLQRLEIWDAEHFAATSEQLAAEVSSSAGIEMWTKDSFDRGFDVNIVVRDLPPDDAMARSLLALSPPEKLELLPASLSTARNALSSYLHSEKTSSTFRRFFRWDPVENVANEVRPASKDDGEVQPQLDLQPGGIYIVDSCAPLFKEKVLVETGERGTLDDARLAAIEAASIQNGTSEYAASILLPHVFLARAGSHANDDVSSWTKSINVLSKESSEKILGIFEELTEAMSSEQDSVAHEILTQPLSAEFPNIELPDRFEIIADEKESPGFVIITSYRPTWDRWESIFEVSSKNKRVPLVDHSMSVANRTRSISTTLGLVDNLSEVLFHAGVYHDRGKEDTRFQTLLYGSAPGDKDRQSLAKSGRRSYMRDQLLRSKLQLDGWRHEQLSTAIASLELPKDLLNRSLAVRLVGTTHGFGRSVFNDNADALIHPMSEMSVEVIASAKHLFDMGIWEHIIDQTNHEYGFWTCAYLEALLRAADATISKEGK